MIREVVLRGSLLPNEQRLLVHALGFLQRELGCDAIRARGQLAIPEVCISLQDWACAAVDILGFDRLFASLRTEGEIRVVLWSRDWLAGTAQALELLTRYQRLLPLPLDFAPMRKLQQILAVHQLLHPLERAEARERYDHSLDTWRWVLRLDPEAAPALQLAALFHDVGNLDRPCGMNGRCGRSGAGTLESVRRACRALQPLALDAEDVASMVELMVRRDMDSRPQVQLLNDADALSFFSLSTWQLLRRHGERETRAKVTQVLRGMSDIAICLAVMTRQPPAVCEMLDGLLGVEPHSEERPRSDRDTRELAT